MILKLKTNLIWNTLNFVSTQLNYLLASPISYDYPFKLKLKFFKFHALFSQYN
jgi:hypothetical protein